MNAIYAGLWLSVASVGIIAAMQDMGHWNRGLNARHAQAHMKSRLASIRKKLQKEFNVEWSDEDKATLAGMKRAGLPTAAIVKRLGKSRTEVFKQAKLQGAYRRLDHHGGSNRSYSYVVKVK